MLNKEWIDDWMGRNDVVMRNEAYTEIVDALRAQADAQPAGWWDEAAALHAAWASETMPAAATELGKRTATFIADCIARANTHLAPEAAQAWSEHDIGTIAATFRDDPIGLVRAVLRQVTANQAAQAGLRDGEIQALWNEACHDTPQKPGWCRHIRFARSIESTILTRAGAAPQDRRAQFEIAETARGNDVTRDSDGLYANPFVQERWEDSAATVAEPSKFSVSKRWLAERLERADDADCAVGQSKSERPCDAPPGCNAANCLGCGEKQAEPVEDERDSLAMEYLQDRVFEEMQLVYKAFGALDDKAVDRFAKAMKRKMKASRKKGRSGWDDPKKCPPERLAQMLIDHIAKGDPVDVGNFAMMLFNRPDAAGVLAQVAAKSDQRASVADDVREIIAAYVADERRYLDGKGEPYGSISTDIGMRARALLAAAPTPAAQGGV